MIPKSSTIQHHHLQINLFLIGKISPKIEIENLIKMNWVWIVKCKTK
jgi:hypothetical protein